MCRRCDAPDNKYIVQDRRTGPAGLRGMRFCRFGPGAGKRKRRGVHLGDQSSLARLSFLQPIDRSNHQRRAFGRAALPAGSGPAFAFADLGAWNCWGRLGTAWRTIRPGQPVPINLFGGADNQQESSSFALPDRDILGHIEARQRNRNEG